MSRVAGADPFDLAGRTAIVTGASSGLGERFARVLHASGVRVVVAARRKDRLVELARTLGEGCVPMVCDVADEAQTQGVVDTALDHFGGVDILVNNAGIGTPQPAESETTAHFREVFEVNVTGLFTLTRQAAIPMLAAGRGSIINIASIFGLVAATPIRHGSYAASKGAVVQLTRELGCQWSRRGVRVNAIAPGWFPTEMTASAMFEDDRSLAYIERETPMARPGEAHELDGVLVFLASDASSYVTGQVLAVDGGWTAR